MNEEVKKAGTLVVTETPFGPSFEIAPGVTVICVNTAKVAALYEARFAKLREQNKQHFEENMDTFQMVKEQLLNAGFGPKDQAIMLMSMKSQAGKAIAMTMSEAATGKDFDPNELEPKDGQTPFVCTAVPFDFLEGILSAIDDDAARELEKERAGFTVLIMNEMDIMSVFEF